MVAKIGRDGAHTILEFVKNRDAARGRYALEPVWTGHHDSSDNPLTLRMESGTAPPSEAKLPPTAMKMLGAVRASGPLDKASMYQAAPGVDPSTHRRNLKTLMNRGLVTELPDGRIQAVEDALPTDREGL